MAKRDDREKLTEDRESKQPKHGNYLQAFFVTLFIATTSAALMLMVPNPDVKIGSTKPIPTKSALTKLTPTPLPTVNQLQKANRESLLSELNSCVEQSLRKSTVITPPDNMTELAKPGFPDDLGFGPAVVHKEIPGSGYLHVLYSTTPLPKVGALDPYAAPLIVDTQTQNVLDEVTIVVGVSTPIRGFIPANWLNEHITYLSKCLVATHNNKQKSDNLLSTENKTTLTNNTDTPTTPFPTTTSKP